MLRDCQQSYPVSLNSKKYGKIFQISKKVQLNLVQPKLILILYRIVRRYSSRRRLHPDSPLLVSRPSLVPTHPRYLEVFQTTKASCKFLKLLSVMRVILQGKMGKTHLPDSYSDQPKNNKYPRVQRYVLNFARIEKKRL